MTNPAVRPLVAADLDEVVEIDRQHIGWSRRDFFNKRLAAALKDPGHHIQVGVDAEGEVAGYLLARTIEGEFGRGQAVILEDIGVAPEHDHSGVGNRLIAMLDEVMRQKGYDTIQTNAAWTAHELLRFFDHQGFTMAPRHIVECATSIAWQTSDDDVENNGGSLARDRVYVRLMTGEDGPAIAAIDSKITGSARADYLERTMVEALNDSSVRVSLVAEHDGFVVGFIMARVDFGDFGQTDPVAVIDTIGVKPDQGHHGIGAALLSQLMMNLAGLQIEKVRTEISRENFDLLAFLYGHGFTPSDQLALERRPLHAR
jgi:ribosomal protein S18 acetylase RimI-like enzyme